MNKDIPWHHRGVIGELLFDAQCLDRGLKVFAAVSPYEDWDRVVNGKNIDVKSSYEAKCAQIQMRRSPLVDFYALYYITSGCWYIFPASVLTKRRFFYDDEWLERWDLLE